MSSSHSKDGSARKDTSEIPLLEWIVGALGLVMVLAAVGVLILEAACGDKSPPDVNLKVEAIVERQHDFLVKIHAQNIGGEPAARVDVTAELMENAAVVETSGMQFAYLPPHSAREAGIFFQHDPRGKHIRLQARGYEVP